MKNFVKVDFMEKLKQLEISKSALDEDIIEILAEAQDGVPLSIDVSTRMKAGILDKIKQEKSCESEGFFTQREKQGEWINAMPGAQYKILHDDKSDLEGVISYLIKLEAGTEIEGHHHPFDEECLMLEGDLTLGDLTLNKGDFHFAAAGLNHGQVSTKNGCIAFIRGALPI